MAVFASLLLAAAGADFFGSAEGVELAYKGRFTPVAVQKQSAAEESFSVNWFLARGETRDNSALFVTTEGASALPWPGRFGFCSPEGGANGPQIGYRFGDHESTVPLPGVRYPQVDEIVERGEMTVGRWQWKFVDEQQVDGRDCVKLDAKTSFGHDRSLIVEKGTGLIIRHEESVTLGRGDRFRLTLELSEATPLDGEQTAGRVKVADALRRTAEAVGQGQRDPGLDVPAARLAATRELAAALSKAANGTSFASLAADITRDLEEQQVRAQGIDALAEKVVGAPAPPLKLVDLDEQPISETLPDDAVIVLHFWDYDHGKLAAPYGQVGYLDFLHRQRGRPGVAVIGVAVNDAFGDPKTRRAAVRSAKNLIEFMNLDYPVATDDGTLLKAIGDPRPLGASLPLWVVIDRDRVIRTYKAGLYELEANTGLVELEAAVTKLTGDRDEK